jgi:antitoxin CptB
MAADARVQHLYIGSVMPSRDIDTRRKRLLFRSWHRGTREADLLLGSFADANLGQFDDRQLDHYEKLLDVPDADLFDWIGGRTPPPSEFDGEVTRLLLAFRYDPRVT